MPTLSIPQNDQARLTLLEKALSTALSDRAKNNKFLSDATIEELSKINSVFS